MELDRRQIIYNAANKHRVKSAVRYFSDLGIESILLKGWSLARFYDTDTDRSYTDVDLAFDPKVADAAMDAWRKIVSGKFIVDLHIGMRDLDNLSWDDLFSSSYTIELDGTPIRVLADEDNLRVTAAHWLIDGGVNKDKLYDIYFLVKNRKIDFDWDRCLDAAGPTRRKWVIAVIAAARDYLELDVSDLPQAVKTAELPDWFIKTLEREWRLGPYRRVYLSLTFGQPRLMLEQIRRRFPPNPIAATVDVEGEIDEGSRIPYQIRSLRKKVRPMISGLYRRYVKRRD